MKALILLALFTFTTVNAREIHEMVSPVAQSIPYDNSASSLVSANVQAAINELSLALASGVQNYNVVSLTTFSSAASIDTMITGMTVTPSSGTYAIWFNAQVTSTGAGLQLDATVYNGATPLADSKRQNLSTAGTHIFQISTQTISQFNGTNAATVKVNPNGNSFNITGRSLLLIRLGP